MTKEGEREGRRQRAGGKEGVKEGESGREGGSEGGREWEGGREGATEWDNRGRDGEPRVEGKPEQEIEISRYDRSGRDSRGQTERVEGE